MTIETTTKKKPSKARNGAGTVERRGAQWWVQVSLPRAPGEKLRRKRIPIADSAKMTEGQAQRAGATLAADVRAGRIVFDETPRGVGIASAAMTVRALGKAWTTGELFKTHGAVNGLRRMAGGYIMGTTLNARAYTVKTRGPGGGDFGDLPIGQVTHSDIAKIMATQTGAASTRNHVHNYLARIFALAEIPLGLRPVGSNPVLKAYRAPADEGKHFNFLFPSEVLALLANTDIPLGRRVLYLLSSYFGWRKGTLRAFRWSGVDWSDGTVSVLHQKGHQRLDASDDAEHGVPIFFHEEPASVLAVLRAWYEHCGQPKGDVAVICDLWAEADEQKRENHDEAKVLRADLKASGVTRELLFSKAKNVQAIRFHDGRATMITWARRAGKDDSWIRARSGHAPGGNMIDRYARMAQTLADLNYRPFPDVTEAIPELAKAARLHTGLHNFAPWAGATEHEGTALNVSKPLQCEGGDLNPYANYGASTSS